MGQNKSTRTGISLFSLALLGACPTSCATESDTTSTGIYEITTGEDPPLPTLVTGTTGIDDATQTESTGTSSTSSTEVTTTTIPDFGDLDKPCNGKIDFIFLIDRAHYMEPFWPRLHEAYPKFIDNVLETYDGFDMRFMTLDTLSGWGLPECEELCSESNTCEPFGPSDFPCDGYSSLTECDSAKGSGLVYPAGFEAANRDCGAVPGTRYISTDQDDVADRAKCIGQVGYTSASGWAYSDLAAALTPGTEGSQCNGHFLRDDAMLFILWIEGAEGSPPCSHGVPGGWAETVYAAKNWDKDKVVTLGIIDHMFSEQSDCWGGNAECSSSFLNHHIKHKIIGSICAESYVPFFEQSLDLLHTLCDPNEVPTTIEP